MILLMSKSFSIMKIIFNYSDWAGSLEVECPPRTRVVLVCYEIINKKCMLEPARGRGFESRPVHNQRLYKYN